MAAGVSYFGSNWGTTMAISYNVGANKRINSFQFRLGNVQSGHQNQGSLINTSTRRRVRGAIWTSRPTSPNTVPQFLSTNEVNVDNCYSLPRGAAGVASNLTLCTFNFSNAVVSPTSIWIGLYTPYPSVSALCFARDGATSGSLLYNENTAMDTWADRGLKIYGISAVLPISPPNAPRSLTMVRRIVEAQNYTLSWAAPSGGDPPTGYRLLFNDTQRATTTSRSYTTNYIGSTDRGGTFTWKVQAYNSAGNGGAASITGRRNQLPTAATSIILNNNVLEIKKGNTFNIRATGARAPAGDEASAYGDSVARFEIQYRRQPYEGTWSGWMNLKNAAGAAAYSFPATANNLNVNVPVPIDVTYGDSIQFKIFSVDSLGAKSAGALSSTLLKVLWQNVRIRDGNSWILADAHVRDNGVWKLATAYVRDNGTWKRLSST